MERDLRDYLDKIVKESATKSDLRDLATKSDLKDFATKADLESIRKEIATKSDIVKLDKKIDKVEKSLIGYIKHIDTQLQDHRHNTELHKKVI